MTATIPEKKSSPVAPPIKTSAPKPAAAPVSRRVKACQIEMGIKTASGYIVDMFTPVVALPSRHALGTFVRVTNPATGLSTLAWVADVGPWNENDDAYVFGAARPQAETPWSKNPADAEVGRDTRGRRTNRAGIGLGEATAKRLGVIVSAEVFWEFIS